MTPVRLILVALLLAGSPLQAASQSAAPAANKTYDAVVGGMTCRQQQSGQLDCAYVIGESLRFVISGVGQEDAVVSFTKVDSAAGYVGAFAPLHGCVVVRAVTGRDSAAALAFVSPRDGRVYRVWQHCRQPPKR